MDIMCILIKMIDGVSRNKNVQFREPLNVTVVRGEHVAIIGNNGAGKSLIERYISSFLFFLTSM